MTTDREDEPGVYATIAAAEKAITDAGYVRDSQRHIWVHPGTQKTCKVVRTEKLQFIVQGA